MNHFWTKSDQPNLSRSKRGDRLAFWPSTPADIAHSIPELLAPLPDVLREYTSRCMDEHGDITNLLLESGYVPVEICFRDYLSGPHNEIAGTDTEMLSEAFEDPRYELVPTIVFVREQDDKDTEQSGSSSLFIEYHTRGMAF